ncbi:MAG: hypothetical protein EOP84_17110 [Verrucomicrobiaceae bacterium]|nr:MAG: hypothetical protein EOP84_17110 [Verrucomicrobiaceae bacterium]
MDFPPPGFEPHHRFDFFEPNDKTALVCLDVPEMQRLVIDQLVDLDYKIHTGMFLDDSILKLRAHAYDLILVSEHFNGVSIEAHPILSESVKLPAIQRRRQLIIVIGSSLSTNDELEAFAINADIVISLADVINLRPVIRRAVNRSVEFYSPLNEAIADLSVHEAANRGVA